MCLECSSSPTLVVIGMPAKTWREMQATFLPRVLTRSRARRRSSAASAYSKSRLMPLDMARELGVPLFTAAIAMQLFQAGKTKYPEGDNWVVTRIIEDIIGAELTR